MIEVFKISMVQKVMGSIKVLGIDPGTLFCGFGIVKLEDHQIQFLSHGTWALKGEFNFRLSQLIQNLENLLESQHIDYAVVEKVFLGKNVDSGFKLGHARGICLGMLSLNKIKILEVNAKKLKKQITGYGNASKENIKEFLVRELKFESDEKYDATDALALAYYGAIDYQIKSRMLISGEL